MKRINYSWEIKIYPSNHNLYASNKIWRITKKHIKLKITNFKQNTYTLPPSIYLLYQNLLLNISIILIKLYIKLTTLLTQTKCERINITELYICAIFIDKIKVLHHSSIFINFRKYISLFFYSALFVFIN